MYERSETEYYTAKRKAAARLGVNLSRSAQYLPSNREIRDEVQAFARMHEGDKRLDNLAAMRVAALHMMRLLEPFHPKLIGSVASGHVREGSDIDIHVFSDNASAITDVLDVHQYRYELEHKRVIKHNVERVFTHVHVFDRFTYELTVYERDKIGYVFKSSITGKAMEKATMKELEALIRAEHPHVQIGSGDAKVGGLDPYLVWELLLTPLEDVRQHPRYHPEGDALYHSLQAFELARRECPWDAEMMTAALLHDVGKAIDPRDHVDAGLEALEGTLSDREIWLIAHHMEALAYLDGTLGERKRAGLKASPYFDDLMTLRDIDNRARQPGVEVCTVQEALAFLREMVEGE